MQSWFSNALSKAVKYRIEPLDPRRATLAWPALSIMPQGTICLARLAAPVARPAQTVSGGGLSRSKNMATGPGCCLFRPIRVAKNLRRRESSSSKPHPQPTPIPETPPRLMEISGTPTESPGRWTAPSAVRRRQGLEARWRTGTGRGAETSSCARALHR